MTIPGARSYRGNPSRPIPVWNGILEHLPKMGMAVWVYLWCLDRITYEQDGLGYVLGGAPVKVEQMASELGRSERALRRDLKKLQSRYLRLRWTPFGYVVQVLNSHKFGIWRSPDSPAKNGKADGKIGKAPTKNGRSKEDSAVDTAERQLTAAATGSVWHFLGITPCGPLEFRPILESNWARCDGARPSEAIGQIIDAWEAANGIGARRSMASLFAALDKIRQRERSNGRLASPASIVSAIPELEAEPWNR